MEEVPDMSLKIGFIGTGGFTRFHCNLLAKMENVDVTAFCGTNLGKAETLSGEWSNAKAYSDIEHMLDSQKLDAVYVCVPPTAHGEIEYRLIERNIPFFVEKPLAIDAELPEHIAKQVELNKLITCVGYNFRYAESTARAREMLKDRTVGMAIGYWMSKLPALKWWRNQDGSGGQFIEQTTHIVDLLRYLLGEAKEVYGRYAQRYLHEVEEGFTIDDVGSVTVTFESGAIASINNTCLLPVKHQVGVNVYTNIGVLELAPERLTDVSEKGVTVYENTKNAFVTEHEVFLNAVRTKDPTGILSTYCDALLTQKLTAAALKSAKTGEPVRIG
jgi:predicted dehydrogenase